MAPVYDATAAALTATLLESAHPDGGWAYENTCRHRTLRDWRTGKAQDFDAYDAKAEVVALLAAAGAPVDRLQLFEAVSAERSNPEVKV